MVYHLSDLAGIFPLGRVPLDAAHGTYREHLAFVVRRLEPEEEKIAVLQRLEGFLPVAPALYRLFDLLPLEPAEEPFFVKRFFHSRALSFHRVRFSMHTSELALLDYTVYSDPGKYPTPQPSHDLSRGWSR